MPRLFFDKENKEPKIMITPPDTGNLQQSVNNNSFNGLPSSPLMPAANQNAVKDFEKQNGNQWGKLLGIWQEYKKDPLNNKDKLLSPITSPQPSPMPGKKVSA